MKDIETVRGYIGMIDRRPSSRNGNPRYMISISNGKIGSEYRCTVAYTTPDSSIAYAVGNKGLCSGDYVEARIGLHRGVVSIDAIEPASPVQG